MPHGPAVARPALGNWSRRDMLKWGLAGGVAMATGLARPPKLPAAVSSKWLTVETIKRTTVQMPYREVPARAMARELPHWQYVEVCEVTLKSQVTGFGETLLYYTWGVPSDEAVARCEGQNAAELMWDDSLGAGLQIALFDAVARTLDVPVHALLGKKRYDRTPLSWWNIDMPPEDMASECALALKSGYSSYKTKGRPWFDLWKQLELAIQVVPESFKIDMDFNDTLLDAERAIPILKELDDLPQVDIWETPIPQKDLVGNHQIKEAVRAKVAMHYGNPDPWETLKADACDGFVVGGGATTLLNTAAVCAMAEKPFWLQLVGSQITAAFSLQCGGVFEQARWPAVNCHQLYQHDLLTAPITVSNGSAAVPDAPGLGFELNRDVLEKLKVAKPESRPEPQRLLETRWPDGRVMYLASNGTINFVLNRAIAAEMPYFVKGVTTRLVPDDGSARYRDLVQKSQKQPYFE
ncbi:dgoA protein [bacterium]|nr:dgoA protein [bacterium]